MIHSCRTRSDFDRLRREGVRRSGTRLWIRSVQDRTCHPPRVAFAFGRGVGSAPVRNRVRRQIRALLSDGSVPVPPGLYLVGCRDGVAPISFGDLRREVAELLS